MFEIVGAVMDVCLLAGIWLAHRRIDEHEERLSRLERKTIWKVI